MQYAEIESFWRVHVAYRGNRMNYYCGVKKGKNNSTLYGDFS